MRCREHIRAATNGKACGKLPYPPVSSRGAEEVKPFPPCPPNLLGGFGCNPSDSKKISVQNTGNNRLLEGGVRNAGMPSERESNLRSNQYKEADAIAAGSDGYSPCPQQLSLDIRAMLERTKLANALQG